MSKTTNKHRHFYVNGKLEFSLFFDPKVKSAEKIMEEFTKSNLWQWHSHFFKVKLKSYTFSDDMLRVDIEV